MSAKFTIKALIILSGIIASNVYAQFAIPVGHNEWSWNAWSIQERYVDMTIRDQVASVTVTDNIINPGRSAIEIQYIFPLPPDAAVDQFTLIADGKELSGQILDADEARRVYNDIVRRQRDPGLLEYAGYGFFRSSAFPLGPGKPAQLVVHYTATCKKDGDMVEVWYPMSSGRFCAAPVVNFKITVDIKSVESIANVYSPSLELEIERKSSDRVVASFQSKDYRPQVDFQLFYDVSREAIGATLLTYWPDRNEDGYYLMMVSPSPRAGSTSTVLSKDILIVMDRSGSMSGEKIIQAREAVRFIINNLNPGDRFNFISYNDNVSSCFDALHSASPGNIQLALNGLDRTEASGSTNIYRAL